MAQLHIRDFPDDLVPKIDDLAAAASKSRESWLRELVIGATKQPVVKKEYSLRLYGTQGKANIVRHGDGVNNVGGGAAKLSQEEFEAYKKAKDYIARNEPGDRETAISILRGAFDEVLEV